MKKILTFIIILCLALTAAACDNKFGNSTSNITSSETDEISVEAATNTDKTEEITTKENTESADSADNDETKENTEKADDTDSDENKDQGVAETSDRETVTSSDEAGAEEETESPYLAPDFVVYDLEGNAVKLSDFRGKPIVLNFWARDCYYCTKEMPDFEAMYKKYGDRVEFLMVCFTSFSNKGVEYEQEYIDNNGYTFPIYFDTSNSAVSKYGISAIPQTFFINKDFDLYTYIPGMASAEALEACIGYIIE
jgi:peroxiredoxin